MLSAVPEVDLGIECVRYRSGVSEACRARLRNIEDTEKAKQRLFEKQEAEKNRVVIDDGGFAAARCASRPHIIALIGSPPARAAQEA